MTVFAVSRDQNRVLGRLLHTGKIIQVGCDYLRLPPKKRKEKFGFVRSMRKPALMDYVLYEEEGMASMGSPLHEILEVTAKSMRNLACSDWIISEEDGPRFLAPATSRAVDEKAIFVVRDSEVAAWSTKVVEEVSRSASYEHRGKETGWRISPQIKEYGMQKDCWSTLLGLHKT